MNEAPTIELQVRARGERFANAVDVAWSGVGGEPVTTFQYAFDLPESADLDQVNNPGSGIVSWIDTEDTGALLFSSPVPDVKTLPGHTIIVGNLSVAYHNLFVRAVDDEGAVSRAVYIEFTGDNVAPKGRFVVTIQSQPVDISHVLRTHTIYFDLEAEDLDGPGGEIGAAAFFLKMASVADIEAVSSLFAAVESDVRPNAAWIRIREPDLPLSFSLDPPNDYVWALRAEDSAGAGERILERGRNVVLVETGVP